MAVPSLTETALCYASHHLSFDNQSTFGAVREFSLNGRDVNVVLDEVVTGDNKKDKHVLEDVTVEEILHGLLKLGKHSDKNKSLSNADDSYNAVNFEHKRNSSSKPETNQVTLVTCQNIKCGKTFTLDEAKKTFKTCHSCYTYYCSRSCRKDDWEYHKSVCFHSLANGVCKQAIKKINKDSTMQYRVSRLARQGYLSRGRGCVLLGFENLDAAQTFLISDLSVLNKLPPVFVSLSELKDSKMFGDFLPCLVDVCKTYNPETKYVLHVGIGVQNSPLSLPVPRRNDPIVQKCARLRLNEACHHHPEKTARETVILTVVYGGHLVRQSTEARQAREESFINVQRKLRERGINLRHQFADVYDVLLTFVADAKHFSPKIIYPVDGRTGQCFMCVIMTESEPEIEWVQNPDPLWDLDLSEEISLSSPS